MLKSKSSKCTEREPLWETRSKSERQPRYFVDKTWTPWYSAMKSAVGHTETASGMVALMQPSISLVHNVVQKILHLRSLNPHIASIIGKNEFVSCRAKNWRVARN